MRIKKLKMTSALPPIIGVIMPSRWNEDGKPARIAIHTDDRKEYQIDFSGVGKELLNLTYKRLAVEGKIREQLNGRAILNVRKYQIIEDAPENRVPKTQKA